MLQLTSEVIVRFYTTEMIGITREQQQSQNEKRNSSEYLLYIHE